MPKKNKNLDGCFVIWLNTPENANEKCYFRWMIWASLRVVTLPIPRMNILSHLRTKQLSKKIKDIVKKSNTFVHPKEVDLTSIVHSQSVVQHFVQIA